MKAFIFPGQGSQFEGMGKDLYHSSSVASALFDRANDLLGFDLSKIMFEGSAEELKQTSVTQPAIFLYSLGLIYDIGDAFSPDVLAGHSLGEITALVAAGTLSFEDGLLLVDQRANAMQKACDLEKSSMAAILGLDDAVVESILDKIDDIVVAANYNCPGQLVISGSVSGIEKAVIALSEEGARRAVVLPVNGAFHSPFMQPAQDQLVSAIQNAQFKVPICPIYQNVSAKAETDPEIIQKNLLNQLTAPVLWTQTMKQMIADGVLSFHEVGGRVLSGFIRRIDRSLPVESIVK